MVKIPCLYEGFEEYCPYCKDHTSCKRTVHHLWWPRRLYTSRLQRKFRNLADGKIGVCRGIHDLFHLINLIPLMPPAGEMKNCIEKKARFRSNPPSYVGGEGGEDLKMYKVSCYVREDSESAFKATLRALNEAEFECGYNEETWEITINLDVPLVLVPALIQIIENSPIHTVKMSRREDYHR